MDVTHDHISHTFHLNYISVSIDLVLQCIIRHMYTFIYMYTATHTQCTVRYRERLHLHHFFCNFKPWFLWQLPFWCTGYSTKRMAKKHLFWNIHLLQEQELDF